MLTWIILNGFAGLQATRQLKLVDLLVEFKFELVALLSSVINFEQFPTLTDGRSPLVSYHRGHGSTLFWAASSLHSVSGEPVAVTDNRRSPSDRNRGVGNPRPDQQGNP